VVIDGIDRVDEAWSSPRMDGCGGRAAAVRAGVNSGAFPLWAAPGGSSLVWMTGRVWLTVRRFSCDHVDCSACTFVEQVPVLTERHDRSSIGVHGALGSNRVGAGPAGPDHGWPRDWVWR